MVTSAHGRVGGACVSGGVVQAGFCGFFFSGVESMLMAPVPCSSDVLRCAPAALRLFALLASVPSPLVLADAPPSALLALVPYPLVLAEALPSALLALAPSPLVLADARPSALLALAPYPSVLAHARPSALLALAHLPLVLALPWLEP